MKSALHAKTDSVEKLWELYSDQEYGSVLECLNDSTEDTDELRELEALSRLELGKPVEATQTGGMFSDLLSAMQRYHGREYEKSALDLSRWLLHRGYYSDLILDRFYFACEKCHRFDLLYTVCSRLIKAGHRQESILSGFLLGAHESGKHAQVVESFESFGSSIRKTYVLHRVALSYIQLKRNREAESMLLQLYKAISGTSYSLDLEKHRKEYSQKLPQLLEMARKGEMQPAMRMELGMAHIFTGQYNEAIQIFQSMLPAGRT